MSDLGFGQEVEEMDNIDDDQLDAELAEVVNALEEPGVLSTRQAEAYWTKIFRALNITEREQRDRFRRAAAVHFLLTSTSTSAELNENITCSGHSYPIAAFVNNDILPLDDLRRFWRSETNINIMSILSLKPVVTSKLQAIARRRGVQTRYCRAVSDVCEFFPNVSNAELSEVHRVRGRKLQKNETLSLAFSPDSDDPRDDRSRGGPPPPSGYMS